jgi:hypothetical protein
MREALVYSDLHYAGALLNPHLIVNRIVDQSLHLNYKTNTYTTRPTLILQDQHLYYKNSWMNSIEVVNSVDAVNSVVASFAWPLVSCRRRWQQIGCYHGYQIVAATCCGRSPTSCKMACLPFLSDSIPETREKLKYSSVSSCAIIYGFERLSRPMMTG